MKPLLQSLIMHLTPQEQQMPYMNESMDPSFPRKAQNILFIYMTEILCFVHSCLPNSAPLPQLPFYTSFTPPVDQILIFF